VNFFEASIIEIHSGLVKREISPLELLEAFQERMAQIEPRVHAYLVCFEEKSRMQAEEAERRFRIGEDLTPLTGIPVAIKDNICVKGFPTTCASRILQNFRPPYDATVVERLEKSGVIFLGKTNMDEFAMGSSTENSAFGPTRNPWNLAYVPGGSSGGSAAAVAGGEAVFALGSDTGGSIRQPASFCGIVGMKPTYGLVSRYGLVAFASSLDQIGPLARTVSDAALVLSCIAGRDPRDSTSAHLSVEDLPDFNFLQNPSEEKLKGMIVGIPKQFLEKGLEPEVKDALNKTVKSFESLGCKIEEISLPSLDVALSAYYVIACGEASSNLARYDGARYGLRVPGNTTSAMFKATRDAGFGLEVKRRILLGTYALSAGYYDAYYLKAQKVRTLLKQDFDRAFKKCFIILTPTSPTLPFKLGEKINDPLAMYLSDVCTIPVNLVGIPGLSIPVEISSNGLPIGVQLLAPAFCDFSLLHVGYFLEKVLDFKKLRQSHPLSV
jgi:aspartyl-tRNA(Asn)/glutamyl-tRNA(Gln) amidotransferase subunit A